MLKLKYINDTDIYSVEFDCVTKNIIQIKGVTPDFPVKTNGFMLSHDGKVWNGDYSDCTTIYRQIDDRVQFSNDGSVYVPPKPPEPYIPTLDEVKEQKVSEMNNVQQMTIQNGIDVTLADGTVEHFSLTDRDQNDLDSLKDEVNEGREKIPWHVDDESIHCRYYSNEDMRTITTAAKKFVTYHVTYFRDLRIYIRSMEDKKSVEAVTYGMYIPPEFQSEVLKDFYSEMKL